METKNKRYDDNVKRVQHVVNDIMSTDVNEFKVRFSNSYINKLNNRTVRYDPSSNDSTDSIIIWLYQGASLIWRQLTDENK